MNLLFSGCCTVCRPTAPEDSPQVLSVPPKVRPFQVLQPNAAEAEQKAASAWVSTASSDKRPLMPFTRIRRDKVRVSEGLTSEASSILDLSPDGGTGGDPGDGGQVRQRSSVKVLRRHSSLISQVGRSVSIGSAIGRRDSQHCFAHSKQTVIVFDWDDTLFPTSYVNDDLDLNWQEPLSCQPGMLPEDIQKVEKTLARCEEGALEVLRGATELAHVVVVTLASNGWVDLACEHFYPAVGSLIRKMKIPVVYAQEKAGISRQEYDKMHFSSSAELERFWGLAKGQAISEEVEKFYSQYAGQSWKNLLSIGDASFERYGLLAAASAYMQGRPITAQEATVWSPTQEGCWQKVQDGHVKKLRAKCCKLVDQPDASELTVELDMVSRWLQGMVRLDAGFDLDLECVEDEAHVNIIEAVFRGERPVSDLPRPAEQEEEVEEPAAVTSA
mmetsp:Transcript_34890/g.94513  ORF Transcript_34890/g.94513 Transcript_34890/m.94513 type:complete len:443 (-) Transcript_34890:63-1391(-)